MLNFGEDITAGCHYELLSKAPHISIHTHRNRQFYFASAATFITKYFNMCNRRCMNSHEIAQKKGMSLASRRKP